MMQRIMNSKNLNELNKVLAKDKYGQLVFLADSDFTIQMTKNKYPSVKLYFTSEFEYS
jgi:peptide chain release factor 3